MITIKNSYMKRKLILYVSIMFFYIILKNIYTINNIPKEFEICVFDLMIGIPGGICGGNLDALSMIVPFGMGFIIFIINLMEIENNNNIILKNIFRNRIWRGRCKKILKISLMISIILVIFSYIISGFMLEDFSNKWMDKVGTLYLYVKNEKVWDKTLWILNTKSLLLILILMMFLGFSCLGIFIINIQLWLKKQYTYMVTTLIIVLTYFIDKINFFSKASTLSAYKLVQPKYIIYDILTSLTILSIFYMIGEEKIVKKDFYNDIIRND